MKRVGISVWGDKGARFRDGKRSKTFRVYDAEPDEVLRLIEKALTEASGNSSSTRRA